MPLTSETTGQQSQGDSSIIISSVDPVAITEPQGEHETTKRIPYYMEIPPNKVITILTYYQVRNWISAGLWMGLHQYESKDRNVLTGRKEVK